MEKKITIVDALIQIRNGLNSISVVGPYNAKILSAAYDDLGVVINTLIKLEGGEKDDSSKNVVGDV